MTTKSKAIKQLAELRAAATGNAKAVAVATAALAALVANSHAEGFAEE